MLLQTGLIRRLTAAAKTVALIVPDAADANIAALKTDPRISVYEATFATNLWSDDYLFKRKYYLEDIEKNPALWEKHVQSVRYNTSKHPWRRVRPFLYYGIYKLNKIFPGIRARFQKREKTYLQSEKVTALLREIQPEVVVSTYPVSFLEAQVLYAAKTQNITTVTHLLSWDNITAKGHFPVVTDYYLAWGEIMRSELKQYYNLPDERISVCGVPHFDEHFKIKQAPRTAELLTDLGLNPKHPYLFVPMSSPVFSKYEVEVVEWLAAAVRDDVFGEKMQLLVRPHPQNMTGFMADKSWLGRLQNLVGNRVGVDFPQLNKSKMRWSLRQKDMNRLANTLAGCAVCLNIGSTVSIEALLYDKPVILTSFDADRKLPFWRSAKRLVTYTHMAKFVAAGGAEVADSYTDLTQKIKNYLDNPSHRMAERQNALNAECRSNDGKNTERAVATVLEILQKETQPKSTPTL